MGRISTALLSVWDKDGIVHFARELSKLGVRIISTGGTHALLESQGIPVTRVDDVTGFPEMLDGRVKTLHPLIHGGLLARRNDEKHRAQAAEHGIEMIDLVVVNLYPFEKTAASGASHAECIEQIDIGGPAMLRSAAKNHESVTVICDPKDYDLVLREIADLGDTTGETRAMLAAKVFERTSSYDTAISVYLTSGSAPDSLPASLRISQTLTATLRYGENPHQKAALYGSFFERFHKLHGKELSFNNIVDMQAASALVEEFSDPCAAVIKHTNPCGCAVASDILTAWREALTTDPASAYGGVVALNRTVDASLAAALNELFTEIILAPGFNEDALELLRKKRDRRILEIRGDVGSASRYDIKTIANGYLCQTVDSVSEDPESWSVVTKRQPTAEERAALAFAWKVAKHVKSNAIVYTNASKTLGIGAGQMSRVDSSAIAVMKARSAGLSLQGSVVASDAYFPFADGLLEAVKAGATAVVQPGGSVRDGEVIEAADNSGIAMLFTGIRHFKH